MSMVRIELFTLMIVDFCVQKSLTDTGNLTTMERTEEEELSSKDQEIVENIKFLTDLDLNVITYGPPVLLAIGVLGNTLTVAVLKRPSMKSGSSVILMALAVADTLALAVGPIRQYAKKVHDINIEEESYFICKTHRYIKFIFAFSANWLIVVFTIFRVIAVYLPHKVNIYCTRKRAYFSVLITVMSCCVVNLDSIISKDLIPVFNKRGDFTKYRCGFEGAHGEFYSNVFPWVLMGVMSLAPFAILLIGNSMIIYKLIWYRDLRKQLSTDNKSSESQSMTAMLISISLLFLVTQTPAIISSMIKNDNPTLEEKALLDLLHSVFSVLRFSNNAVNFFCYCISGRKFREELVNAFREWYCWRKGNSRDTELSQTNVTSVH